MYLYYRACNGSFSKFSGLVALFTGFFPNLTKLSFIWYICTMLSESAIQAAIVRHYTNTYCLTHHVPRHMILSIPNGGTRNPIEAMTMKSTGLLPGASDLIVLHGSILLWVEVKTEIGRLSKEQLSFQSRIEALGYKYYVVRSLDEFKLLLNHKSSTLTSDTLHP